MGYFAGRAAPMGAVPSAVVEATFYNFAPCMVSRAIPDAWGFATPEHVLEARLTGVGRALEKMLGPSASAQTVRQAAELGRAAIEGLNVAGRPLAAANLALPIPDDPSTPSGMPQPCCESTGGTVISARSSPPSSAVARPTCRSPRPVACPDRYSKPHGLDRRRMGRGRSIAEGPRAPRFEGAPHRVAAETGDARSRT